MFKCIGAKHKEGSMTDDRGNNIEWDYIRYSCITDEAPGNYGLSAEVIKIKREDFCRVTGLRNFSDYPDLVDKDIDARYTLSENKPVLIKFHAVPSPASGTGDKK
ncbi:MAG: hypothetical protein E7505_04630 [Ruminococcus sp.]|nr:hypothetical protein [Ruminococcus sp.]